MTTGVAKLHNYRVAGTFYRLRSHNLIWSRFVEQYLLGNPYSLNDLMAVAARAVREQNQAPSIGVPKRGYNMLRDAPVEYVMMQ